MNTLVSLWRELRRPKSADEIALRDQLHLWYVVKKADTCLSDDDRELLPVLKQRLDAKRLLYPAHLVLLQKLRAQVEDALAW